MFSGLVQDLGKGLLPADLLSLKKRFSLALIKKQGVLKLPYHFWTTDSKINPSSEHLLWVVFLLGDCESFTQVESLIVHEIAEQLPTKHSEFALLEARHRERLQEMTANFLAVAPSAAFRHILELKVRTCSVFTSSSPFSSL